MASIDGFRRALTVQSDGLIAASNAFRDLLPHATNASSIHSGEEGRFVEGLLTEFLRRHLPERLEVSTGFVADLERGSNSGQIDILVYDSHDYAPILKYGDSVVLPSESVVAAISVKKNLRKPDVAAEVKRVSLVGDMCGGETESRPHLALFAFDTTARGKLYDVAHGYYDELLSSYPDVPVQYGTNQLIDSITVLNKFIIKKERWHGKGANGQDKRTEIKYLWAGGARNNMRNFYLQDLLRGIGYSLHARTGNPLDQSLASPGATKMMFFKSKLKVYSADRGPLAHKHPELFR